MHRLLPGAVIATLAVGGAAQTTFPPGFVSTEGAGCGFHLGYYANGRCQLAYGDLQGSNQTFIFRELSIRNDATAQRTNFGRTWADVRIQVGDSDYTRLSNTFAENLKSPTLVFSGSMTWPSTTAQPSAPAPWGSYATSNDMRWPFGTGGTGGMFLHRGASGFAIDFVFTGGALANADPWTGKSYHCDGIPANNQWFEGPGAVTSRISGCTDGFFATWLVSEHLVAGGGQHRAQEYLSGGPPNTLHVGVIGVEAFLPTRAAFPGSCNYLYYDFATHFAIFPFVTDPLGEYRSQIFTTGFVPAAVGLRIDTQAAFADAAKTTQLTRAGRTRVPPLPAAMPRHFASLLYWNESDATVGFGPLASDIPIVYCR